MMIAICPMALPAVSPDAGAHLVTNAIVMTVGGAGIDDCDSMGFTASTVVLDRA
jgi:hypothetical protein